MQKLASMMPTISNYPVLLERLFDSGEVQRIQADNRRSSVSSFMEQVAQRAASPRAEAAAQARTPVQEVQGDPVDSSAGVSGVDGPVAGGGAG